MKLFDRIEKIENVWIKMALAPVMGALFLMFLPAIGFVLVGYALYQKIIEAFTGDRTQVASLPS